MPPAEVPEPIRLRNKIRHIKLCQISSSILSILTMPKTTEHQDGLGRGE